MRKSYGLILAAGALWGCISVFFRMLTGAGFTPMQAVTLRVFVAAAVFAVYLLCRDRGAFRIRLRDIPLFIGTGILSLAAFNFCYFTAIEMSSVAVAAVLLYTSPVFVMLLSAVVFREKITSRKVAALVITFLGCMLVTGVLGGGEKLPLAAVLYGVGSGLGYALYSIFGKLALRKYSSETITLYTFVFAFIGVAPFSRFTGMSLAAMRGEAVLGALGLGTLCCVLPYILYTKGLERVEAGRAAIVATIEPVVAAVIGAVVFREPFTAAKIAGILLVLGAIVILNIKGKKGLQ